MRTRPWTALIVVAGLAVTGCGGGESAGDGPRLTRAEATLTKHHQVAAQRVLGDPEVGPEDVLEFAAGQCEALKRSGPTLRALGPACDQATIANRELLSAETGTATCSADDLRCGTRHFRRMAIAFARLDRVYQQTAAILEPTSISDTCRTLLAGSKDLHSAVAASARSSKAMLAAVRGATDEANTATPNALLTYATRLDQSNKALADASLRMQAASDADLKIDAAACDGDAE